MLALRGRRIIIPLMCRRGNEIDRDAEAEAGAYSVLGAGGAD